MENNLSLTKITTKHFNNTEKNSGFTAFLNLNKLPKEAKYEKEQTEIIEFLLNNFSLHDRN